MSERQLESNEPQVYHILGDVEQRLNEPFDSDERINLLQMVFALGIGVGKGRLLLVIGGRCRLFRFTIGLLSLFSRLFPLGFLFRGQLDFSQVGVVVYPQVNVGGRSRSLDVSRVMTKLLAEFDHVEVGIEIHLAQGVGMKVVLIVIFILEDGNYAFVSFHCQGELACAKGGISLFLQEPGALHVCQILTRRRGVFLQVDETLVYIF